jgi:hypothetical protein
MNTDHHTTSTNTHDDDNDHDHDDGITAKSRTSGTSTNAYDGLLHQATLDLAKMRSILDRVYQYRMEAAAKLDTYTMLLEYNHQYENIGNTNNSHSPQKEQENNIKDTTGTEHNNEHENKKDEN